MLPASERRADAISAGMSPTRRKGSVLPAKLTLGVSDQPRIHRFNGANHGDLTFLGFDTNIAKPWSSQQVMQGIMSFLTKHLGRLNIGALRTSRLTILARQPSPTRLR